MKCTQRKYMNPQIMLYLSYYQQITIESYKNFNDKSSRVNRLMY